MHTLERRLSKLEPSAAAGRLFVARGRDEADVERVLTDAGAGPRDMTIWLRVFCDEGDTRGEAQFLYGMDDAGRRWGPDRVTVDVTGVDLDL